MPRPGPPGSRYPWYSLQRGLNFPAAIARAAQPGPDAPVGFLGFGLGTGFEVAAGFEGVLDAGTGAAADDVPGARLGKLTEV